MKLALISAHIIASSTMYSVTEPDASSHSSVISSTDLRSACVQSGGTDLTDAGTVIAGEDVGNVVVCQHLGRSRQQTPRLYKAQWGSNASAILHPPTGTYTVSTANPKFTTGCSADVYVRGGSAPNKIVGESTLSCNGYVGQSSAGCNVSWSGQTEVFFGQSPGAVVSVTFDCIPRGNTQIGTSMNYRWRGGRGYDVNIRGTQGLINVVYQ